MGPMYIEIPYKMVAKTEKVLYVKLYDKIMMALVYHGWAGDTSLLFNEL